MSVEFSGHSTKSGTGRSPARACAISVTVSDMWLFVTDLARPNASSPTPSTLPCTIPTVIVSVGCDVWVTARAATAPPIASTYARLTTATARRRCRPVVVRYAEYAHASPVARRATTVSYTHLRAHET